MNAIEHPIRTTRSLLFIAWVAVTVFTLWDALSHALEGQMTKQQVWNALSTNHRWVFLSCILLAVILATYAVRLITGIFIAIFTSILFFGISHAVENRLAPNHIIENAVKKCAPSVSDLALHKANDEGIPTSATGKVGGVVHHYSVHKSSGGDFSLVDQATGKVLSLAGCQ